MKNIIKTDTVSVALLKDIGIYNTLDIRFHKGFVALKKDLSSVEDQELNYDQISIDAQYLLRVYLGLHDTGINGTFFRPKPAKPFDQIKIIDGGKCLQYYVLPATIHGHIQRGCCKTAVEKGHFIWDSGVERIYTLIDYLSPETQIRLLIQNNIDEEVQIEWKYLKSFNEKKLHDLLEDIKYESIKAMARLKYNRQKLKAIKELLNQK
jgi:hypothetical protein